MHRDTFRKLAKTIYIPGFLMFVGHGMTAPIIPIYAKHLGASLALAGLVVSFRGFGQLLFNLPAGMMIARLGNRRLLLVSTIGIIGSAAAMGFSKSAQSLIFWAFLSGGFHSTWQMTRVYYVREVAPPTSRGRAISAIGGLVRIGSFVGPIVGGFIAQFLGFAATFYAQAAITALSLLFYIKPDAVSTQVPETSRNSLSTIGTVLKQHRRSFLTVGLVALSFSAIRAARQTILPLWGDSITLGVAAIGLIVGFSSGADMMLFIPAGIVMDRKGRKWTAVPSLLIMSGSLLLLPGAETFTGLLFVGLAVGLGNGFGAGIVMTLGTDLAPDENTGIFLGLWFLISGIGSTLAPLMVGVVADAVSLGTAATLAGFVGIAGALYFLFITPETHPSKKR